MAENNKAFDQTQQAALLEGALPDCVAVLLYTTLPSREGAIALGRQIVEQGNSGCINIIPAMTSVYKWNGVTEVADEVVLIAKVTPDRLEAAVRTLLHNHPYDTPALLVIPVSAGAPDYLAWLRTGQQKSPDL